MRRQHCAGLSVFQSSSMFWGEKLMAHSLHRDADAILSRLKQEGVTALYHFTSVKNLPYICSERALYSKTELMARGMLSNIDTGGNDLSLSLDQRNDNWNKVSLSLTHYTP